MADLSDLSVRVLPAAPELAEGHSLVTGPDGRVWNVGAYRGDTVLRRFDSDDVAAALARFVSNSAAELVRELGPGTHVATRD